MKNVKLAIAAYSVVMGISVIGMWALILLTQEVPEGKLAMGFHLYAEFAMAVICIVSGFMMIFNKQFARETNLAGLAMLVYSVINAAGYYGQKEEVPMMIMFIVIAIVSIMAICGHYFYLLPKK